jgi:hypothetical protein
LGLGIVFTPSTSPDSLSKIITFYFTCENWKYECKNIGTDEDDTKRVMAPEN